ncbi:MAG TPA: peroxidase family protein, partial [Kofleriaceae bacterium]
VLAALEQIQRDFNAGGKHVSLADLIVLGGTAAVEQAAKAGGHDIAVGLMPGRTDASQDQTDVHAFAVLEPAADGFRNYQRSRFSVKAEELLIDRAQLLTLSVPEMTVLLGGLRVLDVNAGHARHGVLTRRPGVLTNDFFVHLLDMGTQWKAVSEDQELFEGRDRKTGQVQWTGTRADLLFGSSSQLRSIAEVYASADAAGKFVRDFARVWTNVMNLDRYDVPRAHRRPDVGRRPTAFAS